MLTSEDEAAFDAWLAGDPRALGSYCRVEAALLRLERAGRVSKPGLRAPRKANRPVATRRRFLIAGSAAASLVAGIFGAAAWFRQPGRQFDTRIGEVQEVPLEDGSIVTLNTNSKIAVKYSKQLRQIDLVEGEALFDVAKHKSWPFIVRAGATQVSAIGTSFSVSMLPERPVQVLVREGVVELKRADAVTHISPLRVSANMRALSASGDKIIAATLPKERVKRDLVWQYGQIAFDNKTLNEAAVEFARYNEVHIIVEPAIGDRTITGLFAASDPIGFARLAAAALNLHVEVDGGEVKLSSEPSEKGVGKI